MNATRYACLIALLFLVGMTTACGQTMLTDKTYEVAAEDRDFRIDKEAKISDTEEAREVLNVLAEYRRSLVRKDFAGVKRLIAEDYYDNGSTTNTTKDDYDGKALPELFEHIAKHTESIQYQVTVKTVSFKHKRAFVSYEYRYAYQYKVGDESSWDAGVEVNQLELVRDKAGAWKIQTGL